MKERNRNCFLLTGFLIVFLALFSTQATYSQAREVTGTVTDAETLKSLPGVSVVVKGTQIGAITDANGFFTLSVPQNADRVVFRYVGMVTQELELGTRRSFEVQMSTDYIGVDEVVVTGYSKQMKESLTGAVATVQSDDLNLQPATNAAQRMQGRVSGVTVTNSHAPGGDATVRVRGLGTINNNDPLYVIDGIPTKGGLSQINPNDIETISVLKDASSAAIYGARGANGVIIITTKRGVAGRPNITFDVRTGMKGWANKYDLLDTQEYGELLWLEAKNDGVDPGNALYGFGSEPVIPDYILPAGASEGSAEVDPGKYSYDDPLYLIMKANKEGTDWYDEMYRNSSYQEYNLSITGGTQNSSYAFSGGYMHDEGILLHTGFKRYTLRSNTDTRINNWLEIDQTLGLALTEGYGNRGDNGEGTIISQGYRMQPIIPVYDIMGNFAGTKAPTTGNGQNPVAGLTRDQNDYGRDLRAIGNIFANATLMDGLDFSTLVGFDYRTGVYNNIFIKDPEFSEAKPTDRLNVGSNFNFQWNWSNTLNYSKDFGDSKFNAVIGTEVVSSQYRYMNASRSTFYSTDPTYMFLNAGEADQMNDGLGSDWKTLSYFGRINYDYVGKYLISGTFRRDGSSRFGANNRWGNFPAFSAGWRISNEDFMDGTKNWLDYLKLRVGWGMSGNDEIGNYNGFTTFRTSNIHSNYSLTGNNNATNSGFDSNAFGNPDAKWETTTTTNVGIDATLLNNAFSIGLDVWQRNTVDMLYALAIPEVVGQASNPNINIGDMKNTGFDLLMVYRGKAGTDFTYDITANISRYTNEITKISDNELEFINGGGFRQMTYTRATVGTAFPEFYGYTVDGIFQTEAEAAAHATAFGEDGTYNQPGHFIYRDINGKDEEGNIVEGPDGVIDDADRTYIGSPHPDFTGSLTFDFGYKNFDFSLFFYGSYGNEMVNYVRRWIDYNQFQGNRSYDRLYNSWGSPYLDDNNDATLAMAQRNDNGSQQESTHFVEDASFLRLKNLQIGYTLPSSALRTFGFSKLRIYLQGTNLLTLTKYSGLDPEVRTSGTNMGIDAGAWPTAKTIMLGLSLGF